MLSMLTCSVRACTKPGSVPLPGSQPQAVGSHEAYVCAEHKASMESGVPWDMEGQPALMGKDLAPILKNWSARPSAGSEGFTLTLEIAGQPNPLKLFLMPAEARTLCRFIQVANGDAD